MKNTMFTFLFVMSWITQFVGGLALTVMFFAGIYTFFAKSILIGLAMIGGSMVGGWVVMFVSGILVVAAEACIGGE